MKSTIINKNTGETILSRDFGFDTPAINDKLEIEDKKYVVIDKTTKIIKRGYNGLIKECKLEVIEMEN